MDSSFNECGHAALRPATRHNSVPGVDLRGGGRAARQQGVCPGRQCRNDSGFREPTVFEVPVLRRMDT